MGAVILTLPLHGVDKMFRSQSWSYLLMMSATNAFIGNLLKWLY